MTITEKFSYKGFFCKVDHLSISTKVNFKGKLDFLECDVQKSIVEKTREC